jgi:hypothetical protein
MQIHTHLGQGEPQVQCLYAIHNLGVEIFGFVRLYTTLKYEKVIRLLEFIATLILNTKDFS